MRFLVRSLAALSQSVVLPGDGYVDAHQTPASFSCYSANTGQAFYINLPLAALLTPIYVFVTPSYDPRPDLTVKEKLRTIDWLGAFLIAAVLVLMITTTALAGATVAWDSSTSIALWTMFGVVLLAFGVQQSFAIFTTPDKRIFPIHFLKSRTMVLLFIATACAAIANAVTVYYIPLFFVFTRGDNPMDAAVRLLPFIVVFIFFVMLAGATLPLHGRYSLYYLVGSVLILSGSALMFTVREDTQTARIYGYEVLIAAGAGITFQNGYAVASVKVKEADKSNAIGFINTGQIGMTAVALAVASCLYQNLGVKFLGNALSDYGLPTPLLQASLGGAGSEALASMPSQAASIAIETIAYTIARIFGMSMAAGALLLVAGLAMRHEKVNLAGAAAGG